MIGQIKQNFSKHIVPEDAEFGAGMIEIEEGKQYIDAESFYKQFPVEELTYDALVAVDPENKKGFKPFFDECKTEGAL